MKFFPQTMSSMDNLLIFQGPSIVLLLGTICILLLSFYKILISFEEIVLFIMAKSLMMKKGLDLKPLGGFGLWWKLGTNPMLASVHRVCGLEAGD